MDPSASDDEIAMMRFNHQLELNQTLTTLYLLIEIGRWETSHCGNLEFWRQLCRSPSLTAVAPCAESSQTASLEPDVLIFLTETIAKLRWDESSQMPIPRVRLMPARTRSQNSQ